MKPGIRTTEFFLALIVTVGGALATVFAEPEWAKVAGIIAAVLSSAGYGFMRTGLKVEEQGK